MMPIRLVLLRPRNADNLGAIARAMKNFGLTDWVVVSPTPELLEAPVATQASKLELAGGNASLERQTELGYEKLSLSLPAVVSVSDAINTPRYPALKAIMAAKKKPVEQWSLADLGIGLVTVFIVAAAQGKFAARQVQAIAGGAGRVVDGGMESCGFLEAPCGDRVIAAAITLGAVAYRFERGLETRRVGRPGRRAAGGQHRRADQQQGLSAHRRSPLAERCPP